jgi:hypothetical protein
MILTYTKDVSWKKFNQKLSKLSKLSKFFFQIARFYDQFKYVAKNIEGLCLLSALTPNIQANLAKGMDPTSFYKWNMTFGVTLTVNM